MNPKTRIHVTILAAYVAALSACQGPMDDSGPSQDIDTIQQPLLTYSNPYSGWGVLVVAGRLSANDLDNKLIFWRTDFTCTITTVVGPLNQDVLIDGSNASWLDVRLLGSGQSFNTYCANIGGGTYTNLVGGWLQNGFKVTVNGTGSGDYMNCTGGGATTCNGNGGNDLMESFDTNTTMNGGDGDDKIKFNLDAFTTSSKINGGAGADCISSPPWGTNGEYHCGANPPNCTSANNFATCDRSTHVLGTSCQAQVAVGSCNW